MRAKRRSRLLSHCAGARARAREVEVVSETVAMLPPSFPMRFFFFSILVRKNSPVSIRDNIQ